MKVGNSSGVYYTEKTLEERKKIAYKNLLGLLDDDIRSDLLQLDYRINKIADKIKKQSSWEMTSDGFRLIENVRNSSDPVFEEYDSYYLKRNENGYYSPKVNPFKKDVDYVRDVQVKFLYRYQELLEQLHELLTKKEEILSRALDHVKEEDRERAKKLLIFLDILKIDYDENKVEEVIEESEKKI